VRAAIADDAARASTRCDRRSQAVARRRRTGCIGLRESRMNASGWAAESGSTPCIARRTVASCLFSLVVPPARHASRIISGPGRHVLTGTPGRNGVSRSSDGAESGAAPPARCRSGQQVGAGEVLRGSSASRRLHVVTHELRDGRRYHPPSRHRPACVWRHRSSRQQRGTPHSAG